MRKCKHFTEKYKEEIARLERANNQLGAMVRELEPRSDEYQKKYESEKRLRLQVEDRLRKVESANIILQHRNGQLETAILDQQNILKELEKANCEIKKLQKKLNIRSGAEAPFGLSTSSAKIPFKKNSSKETQAKVGGAKQGHKGHGRKSFSPEEADNIIQLESNLLPCPCGCGKWILAKPDPVPHSVIRFIPSKMEKEIYYKYLNICSNCGQTATSAIPGVAPRSLYSNSMIAHLLTEFYIWGNTAGSIEKKTGVNIGTFFKIAHRVAGQLEPLFNTILEEVRKCQYLHIDETSWRTDGTSGYAWLFANNLFRIFACRHTRGSEVPLEILGEEKLPMIMITDRYVGYNPVKNVERQYCYAHLLRDIKKLEEEFPDDREVKTFVDILKPLLKKAISLKGEGLPLEKYLKKAEDLKTEIMDVCKSSANHPGVQHIQNIFREEEHRLFHWVKSPEIPAENNFAERELRPLVISRKISFGSQSNRGLKTREILMTVLHTAKCRGYDPAAFLEYVLDILANDKDADIQSLLSVNASTDERLSA